MKGRYTDRLPKLDFLRAASAAIVIAYHFGYEAIPAGFGVMTFFVISGFLITFLLLKENERAGTISLRDFYTRRALRIFPAFYVYWLVVIGMRVAVHARVLWSQAICALLYVGNYYQGLHGYPSTPLSHTWSLGVEEQFYLLWPPLFVVFRKDLRRLLAGLFGFTVCIWLYRAVLVAKGVSDAYLYTSFETRVDAILAGCMLAIAVFTGAAAGLLREVKRLRYLPAVLVLLGLSLARDSAASHAYRYVFGYAVESVLVAVLILQLTSTERWAWLDGEPIAYLGRISYSTYLYQQIVLPLLRPRLPHGCKLIGCFLGTWAVAAVSYELVEKPFLRLKKRFEVVKVPEPGVQAVA